MAGHGKRALALIFAALFAVSPVFAQSLTTQANSVFRDYNTPGNALSGLYNPPKADVRTLFGRIDAFLHSLEFSGGDSGGSFDNSSALGALSPGRYILGGGVYRVANDTTVAKGVVLDIRPGSSISVDSGKTLTIHGSVEPNVSTQIFAGAGSVVGIRECRPQWFGASGVYGSGHDDQPALQACMNAVRASVFASNTTASDGQWAHVALGAGTYYACRPWDLYLSNTYSLEVSGAGAYGTSQILPCPTFNSTQGVVNVHTALRTAGGATNGDFNFHDFAVNYATATSAPIGIYWGVDGAGYQFNGGLSYATVRNVAVAGFAKQMRLLNMRAIRWDRLSLWGSSSQIGFDVSTALGLTGSTGDNAFSGDFDFVQLSGAMAGGTVLSINSDSTGCTSNCAQLKGIKIDGELQGGVNATTPAIDIQAANASAVGDIWLRPGTQIDGVQCLGVRAQATGTSGSSFVDNIHSEGVYYRASHGAGCNFIQANASGSGSIKSLFFTNNWFANPGETAINVFNAVGVTVTGNQLYDAETGVFGAAFVLSSVINATVGGNQIHRTGSGQMGGLLNIVSTSDYVSAYGNVCESGTTSGTCIQNNNPTSTNIDLAANTGGEPWVSYTPTISCGTGAFAAGGASATGAYRRVGKTITVRGTLTVTASGIGTCTLPTVSLPFAPVGYAIFPGRDAALGPSVIGQAPPTSTGASFTLSSGSGAAAANGSVLVYSSEPYDTN